MAEEPTTGGPNSVEATHGAGDTPEAEDAGAAAAGGQSSTTRPWYLHPYLAVGMIVGGVVLGALGATRFVAAGSEGEMRETALEELAALEETEAGLRADADAVREEIEAAETAIADIRTEIAAVEAEIADTEAGIADTEAEIADTEAPIRDLQEAVWEVYAALEWAVDLQGDVDDSIEAAVMAGNHREASVMTSQVEYAQSDQLADLDDSIDTLGAAIAGTESILVGTGASLEIAEDFEGDPAGWEAGFESNGVAGPIDGAYVVATKDPLTLMWGVSPYVVADVTVEVIAQPTAGSDAGQFAYGVLCRAEQTSEYLAGYLFAVTGEGGYLVGRYRPPGEWVDIVSEWSGAVIQGLEANQISVTCSGSELVFRVNGITLWSGTDPNLTDGSVALGAYFWGDEAVTVAFDDLRVRAGGGS